MAKFFILGKAMRIRTVFLSLIVLLSLANCTSYDFARRVVEQGNLLPQEKLDRLKPGMGKNEVAILMGTSLLNPMFNNNRWDYAFTVRRGNGRLEVRSLSLYFSGDRLSRIEYRPQ